MCDMKQKCPFCGSGAMPSAVFKERWLGNTTTYYGCSKIGCVLYACKFTEQEWETRYNG